MEEYTDSKKMVYLNYAATSLRKPKTVGIEVKRAIDGLGNVGRSVSGQSLQAGKLVLELRERLAKLFGFSHPERVIFTTNVTQALNMVIFGLLEKGDHVIATDLEHNAVLRPLHILQEAGVVLVDFLKADAKGNLDLDELHHLVKPNTKLIISTHASNVTGNVVDIARIGAFAREHGILFCVDAAQTAGAFKIDMVQQNIDILCFTGHKSLMGPSGTGGCLISEKADIRPLIHGGTGIRSKDLAQPSVYPEHLEAGTLNVHGLAGLLASLDFVMHLGEKKIHEREVECMKRFLRGIEGIKGMHVYGDFSHVHAPIVLLNMDGISSAELADVLAEEFHIEVRAGLHCAWRIHAALGTLEQGAVRFSFGYYTEDEEVDYAIHALREIADAI